MGTNRVSGGPLCKLWPGLPKREMHKSLRKWLYDWKAANGMSGGLLWKLWPGLPKKKARKSSPQWLLDWRRRVGCQGNFITYSMLVPASYDCHCLLLAVLFFADCRVRSRML